VTTARGDPLYQHQADDNRVLVAPWVAAGMTDLLQTAVNTGTGKAAQIGRPVAGKTGTTTSSKDGWFLGFSSGLTTGVWMGRDDAKAIPGLHGGTAPARAFAAFMKPATANRPIEQFETQVTLPDFQLEPDQEFGQPDNGMFVDENGDPIPQSVESPPDQLVDPDGNPLPPGEGRPARPERLDQDWMDHVLGRDTPRTQRTPAPGRPPEQRDRPPATVPPERPGDHPQE